MSNELIVNVTLGETRVARLENGVVAELFIERTRDLSVVGNIYKGRVVRVLPGMQAAFVDIGLERTAFMHAADVVKDVLLMNDAIDQEASADIYDEGDIEKTGIKVRSRKRKEDRFIENLLQEGKNILVQVEKESIGTKGARITSHLSLPGRYLVYMPTVDHVGVSRRIEDAEERERLKKIVVKMRNSAGGFIIRTVAEGASEAELKADVDYLVELWSSIEKKAKTVKTPALIHEELDVLSRVVRDLFTEDIDRIVIDSVDAQKSVKEFVSKFMPRAKNRVEQYEGNEPVFDAFGIEIEITRALGQKVWLKSGGYIIIEQTEALTAIDVNTGRFVGRR
ncbi:MAG: Rne/Rng family ribonuclease, partial [Deltaproteobacteria bacterium CG07_land_8_20_14_0_80_38_7]